MGEDLGTSRFTASAELFKADFRAPHILGVLARLSHVFYCATRLEPLWRLLMKSAHLFPPFSC